MADDDEHQFCSTRKGLSDYATRTRGCTHQLSLDSDYMIPCNGSYLVAISVTFWHF